MQSPLVTIICISFNHAKYIKEALNSIWNLKYSNIELIIADDSSKDNCQELIKELVSNRNVKLLLESTNIGHCKIFNYALQFATGEFVIDFAADDVLLPNSVSQGITHLNEMGKSFGVFFADAEHIDFDGNVIGKHLTTSFFYLGVVPQGDVYRDLLAKFFISPPTMIYRKDMLDEIKGYNEDLSYEDFDFWVRSSRITKYCYLPEITARKRIHVESKSSKQYIKNSRMLISTLEVCKTACRINRTKAEDFALIKRLAYEAKMAFTSYNFSIAFQLFILSLKVFFKSRS